MKLIAVSQRVVIDPATGERRDALDQCWTPFLQTCGFVPLLIPNHAETARQLITSQNVVGVLLTGGNDLAAYGGHAPERDATEFALIDAAERIGLPMLGVCRGMQMLQHHAGVPLQRVAHHTAVRHSLKTARGELNVNSYHDWGTTTTMPGLEIVAMAKDGVIEAVIDRKRRLAGIMWHPERETVFKQTDIDFVSQFLNGKDVWQ
jgi:N5-(cytidine 5'-diphosphoramidyl)-L-glutamine hydrolase